MKKRPPSETPPSNVRPLFPDRALSYGHPSDLQLRTMVNIGWSVEFDRDYVCVKCPEQDKYPRPSAGWALSIQQARVLAAALQHYADKLAEQERERSKGPRK